MTLSRHGRACPGHPDQGRACMPKRDARDKRGHDAVVVNRGQEWEIAR
jgi:hypothetical protein